MCSSIRNVTDKEIRNGMKLFMARLCRYSPGNLRSAERAPSCFSSRSGCVDPS